MLPFSTTSIDPSGRAVGSDASRLGLLLGVPVTILLTKCTYEVSGDTVIVIGSPTLTPGLPVKSTTLSLRMIDDSTTSVPPHGGHRASAKWQCTRCPRPCEVPYPRFAWPCPGRRPADLPVPPDPGMSDRGRQRPAPHPAVCGSTNSDRRSRPESSPP